MTANSPLHTWNAKQAAEALAFRQLVEAFAIAANEALDPDAVGAHANHCLEVSFARSRGSHEWFTLSVPWGVLQALLDAQIETTEKDYIILCPGPLQGGKSEGGTRKIKEHVQGLDLVVLDFDKGDAPLDKLQARLTELRMESAAYATFSHLKDETVLAWSVTRPNAKTGAIETLPSALQTFARRRLGVGGLANCSPERVSDEIFKAFMVDEQGFDTDVLGALEVIKRDKVETTRLKGQEGSWHTHETLSLVAKHRPIAKSRLVLPLARRFDRQPNETSASFQQRWPQDVYLPFGELIGFRFDRVCASIERGHYAMTCKAGRPAVPLVHTQGRLLDLEDPAIQALLEPHKPADPSRSEHAREPRDHASSGNAGQRNDWRGFMAADAAAALLPSTTDKRTDPTNPLVAFPCPFVHEHATSSNPAAHQCYAYNPSSADKLPTVKCQAETCRGRAYEEFLEELFDDDAKRDPQYRECPKAQPTGVYIPREQLSEMLSEINRAWAVVRVGNRVRYLHETPDGDIEIYDGKSVAGWFENWVYFYLDDAGQLRERPIIKAWQSWKYRRQYRGIRFCPEPDGPPAGFYNTYAGFTVEPKAGCWKRLLAHIYRNVCRRNREHFRFFIAWLAQLCQQPHIKPGTNLVLKGKEGVGKSKVGEWIAALFGRNAMTVAESERITGRFNAHLENKLFLMAEEAFWAGDKAAEGKLKDLATGMNMSYERKGLDPYEAQNYTRIMIASNEEWIVPASSGGRRWFVLEVGDDHEKDYAYFAAIDEEMRNGGLAAMLYDLQHSPLPQHVNVRSAPVTPWLVDQRLHSYDTKRRWWRGALLEGGLRDNANGTFIAFNEHSGTSVPREEVFLCARPYFLGPRGVDPSPSEVGQFLRKMLGELPEARPTIDGKRQWCSIFPPLAEMRRKWLEATGELIEDDEPAKAAGRGGVIAGIKVTNDPHTATHEGYAEKRAKAAVSDAVKDGITDPAALVATAERAACAAGESWSRIAALAKASPNE